MRLHVLSTAFDAPTEQACRASVSRQTLSDFDHIYINAAEYGWRNPQADHYVMQIGQWDPYDIVCCLDGDDELATSNALRVIWDAYHAHPDLWLTYGSYMNASNGQRGCSAPYVTADYRQEAWKASHLKTFRAGLFQKLRTEDLEANGSWISFAVDQAIMIPMLEMAGPAHSQYLPEILVIYHDELFSERTHAAGKLGRAMAEYIRAKRPYERIERL